MQNSGIREVQYDLPEMQSGARTVANAWARVPRTLSPQEKQACREKIKRLLKEVGKDKKNEDGMLRIVLPVGIGDCEVRKMAPGEFAALFV